MRVANTIGLTVTAILIVAGIMSTPVPTAHTRRECVPIGAALEAEEAQPEYETIGNWTVRR